MREDIPSKMRRDIEEIRFEKKKQKGPGSRVLKLGERECRASGTTTLKLADMEQDTHRTSTVCIPTGIFDYKGRGGIRIDASARFVYIYNIAPKMQCFSRHAGVDVGFMDI